MSKQIDSAGDIDISQLSFDDLRIKCGTGQQLSSGSGRNKIYGYRYGYMTNIGDIRQDVWFILAERLVKQAGEEDILERLTEYVKTLPWMKRELPSRMREEALGFHMSRIFDNPAWASFIPFNENWRPEALTNTEIINVITECCQKLGRVTAKQIEARGAEQTVRCQHCGRLSKFRRG